MANDFIISRISVISLLDAVLIEASRIALKFSFTFFMVVHLPLAISYTLVGPPVRAASILAR